MWRCRPAVWPGGIHDEGVMRACRGVALLDLLVTCAVVAVLAAVTLPSLDLARDRDAPRLAARHLARRLHWMRIEAVRRNRTVALHFDPNVAGRYALYVDGDGDGVSQRDVDDGVDPPVGPAEHLRDAHATVSLGILTAVPPPDGVGVLVPGGEPVRLGNTRFLSFSPQGTATSGSIYLAGPDGRQWCVRVFGATGRVRVWWYDAGAAGWRLDGT